jgi:Protein of unknown function (DUF2934)
MTEPAKKATTPKKPRTTASKTVAPTGIAAKTAAPKKKTVKAKATPVMVTHEAIALLAHRFWIERGGQHGSHEDDWIRAERELLGKAS